jgi:putative acetyltransferase
MLMTIQLRHETPDDVAAIEAVTIAAFAHAPHTSHTEQFIVRALRAANELTLSIVAEEYGQVIGHVALSPVTITDDHGHRAESWYGLGPISVLPHRQRQGIGSRLMQQALADLRAMQAAGCVLLGDPAYYARFGFQAHAGLQLPGVPPSYFMALALRGAVPEGVAHYSNAFNAAA